MLILLRRELASFFHAPVAYAVGTLFLAVQGTLFWALAQLLSDPSQPAPFGSVLSSYFGGQVLYWLITFVVVAVATMRLFAEERRSGTWETLMTAPVGDWSVVLAKWIAACVFSIALWLPTLVFPLIVSHFAPAGAEIDFGVIATSYLGVFLQVTAFVALGMVASAATGSQVVAASVAVMSLVILLLIGQLPDLASWAVDSPVRLSLEHVDIEGHLAGAARGALDTAMLVFYGSLIAVSLAATFAFSASGRLTMKIQSQRWLGVALVAVIALCANILAARHIRTFDFSQAGRNRIEAATRAVLERVSEPVNIVVLAPRYERFEPIYDEVAVVLGTMRQVQPLLQVRMLDPIDAPGLTAEAARDFGLEQSQLAEGGMIAVRRGDRMALVELLDLATFAADDLGVGKVEDFVAEDVLAAAIAKVNEPVSPVICFTDASGESMMGSEARLEFSRLERRLLRDGLVARRIGAASSGVPRECRVVAVLAPRVAMSPASDRALGEFVGTGGAVFVAGSRDNGGAPLALAELGLGLGSGEVRDPAAEVFTSTWSTSKGHVLGHPITRSFHDRRTTLWQSPRPVVVAPEAPVQARAIVESSTSSSLGQQEAGAVPVAAAAWNPVTGARGVVWGAGVGMELAPPSNNLELLVSSLSWLAGRERVATGGKAPETVRLLLTSSQRVWVFAICVVLLPLCYLLAGALLWWRRRNV